MGWVVPPFPRRHGFTVSGRCVTDKLGLDAPEPGEIVVYLLDRAEVEPGEDLGEQTVVGGAALVDAEVGDVPGADEEAVSGLAWDRAPGLGVAVAAQGLELGVDAVVVGEGGLGEGRHGR